MKVKAEVVRLCRTAVVGVVLATVLAGCASAPGIDGQYTDWDLVSCADYAENTDTYIAHDEDHQQELAEPALLYNSEGVTRWPTTGQYLDEACVDANESVGEVLDQLTPTCTDFLEAPSSAQAEWITVNVEQNQIDTGDLTQDEVMEIVTSSCGELVGGDSDAFQNATFDIIRELATRENDAEQSAALSRQIVWTTTSKLGYEVTVELQLADGPLSRSQVAHPLNDEVLVGEGCGFDATKDLAFAARMLNTNAASTAAAVQSKVNLIHAGAAGSSDDVTSGYIDSGTYCSADNGTGAVLNIHHEDLLEAGEDWGILFFVIVKDFYSPKYPGGAQAELANYILLPGNYDGTTLADPIESLEPRGLSLSLG